MTALDQLWHHIRRRPDALALTCEETSLTFAQLETQARRYAAGLVALGIKRGDRVASLLGTSLELVITLLGHYLLGVVHVPVNTRYGDVEIEYILRDSGAVAVLADEGSACHRVLARLPTLPNLRHRLIHRPSNTDATSLHPHETLLNAVMQNPPWLEEPQSHDEDPALFIYTSGTTGRSKGVILPFRAIVANIDALTQLWQWSAQDCLVLALPLFHVHGLCIGVHGVLLRGCSAVLHRRFEPTRVVDAIAAGGTIFMGVPTMYTRLVKALDEAPELGKELAKARLFTSGSAALPAARFEAFERHTGHRVLERYGMSETLLTVSNPYPPEQRKPGTIGFPVASGEVKIIDEHGEQCVPGTIGDIVVRGDSVMLGYWNAPEKTEEAFRDGWFLTGDVARYDQDGYIVHVGRRSVDIIKSGGYKISAREIEEVIGLHPDIEEVAVFGVADDEWGECIAAAVVSAENAAPRSPEAWQAVLRQFLEGRLADYKQPRQVMVCRQLPRNALGKIQKHLLKSAL